VGLGRAATATSPRATVITVKRRRIGRSWWGGGPVFYALVGEGAGPEGSEEWGVVPGGTLWSSAPHCHEPLPLSTPLYSPAMLSVTFLGTSAARPTVERNVSALSLQREGETLLFECGEGTSAR